MMGLIFIFLPLQLAMAGGKVEFPPWAHCAFWDVFCILGSIAEYTFSIPIRIGFFVLLIPIALTALFAGLLYSIIVAICNWMIYICLRVGITPANPITPPVVTIGWTFTRDFANMFFILILVFIGLATILKLREYEAKKLLPKLIIIALLINFTPVIVGFIVDMGNIVTNFFLSRAANIMNFPTILKMVWDYFSGSLTTIFLWDGRFFEQFVEALGIFIGILIYGVVVIIFFLLGSWIYFWVMLTFFLRIVELWILMILCPIAFFSQVLPPSKTVKMLFPSILHWDKWWEEFLQWVIVGIPLGFFIYLSNWMMTHTTLDTTSLTLTPADGWSAIVGTETSFVGLIVSILSPTVGLVMLYKGYKIAKETAPAAARAIIEGVKKVGEIAVAAGITAVTMRDGAGFAAKALGKGAAGAKGMEASMGKIPIFGKALKYGVGKPISWATRGVEMAAGPTLERYAMRGEEVARKEGEEAKKRDVMGNLRAFRRTFDPAQKREILSTMIDEKQTKDALDEHVVGKSEVLSKKEILTAYEDARKKRKIDVAEKFEQSFKDETIRTEMAKIQDKVTAKLAPDEQTGAVGRPSGLSKSDVDKGYTSFEEKIMGEIKTAEEIKRLQKGWWEDAKLMEAAQKFWGGPQLGRAADEFGRKFVEDYMEVVDRTVERVGAEGLVRLNPRSASYLSGNAAQDLGFRSPEGLGRAEIRELIKHYREEREREERVEAGMRGLFGEKREEK